MVGAGAIGNEVCKHLGMIGIGKLILVDFDQVTESNLNRCIFFRAEDHGKISKVDALRQRLPEIAPDTEIVAFNTRIEHAPDEAWDADLVLVGVDNDYARFFINVKLLSMTLEETLEIPIISGAMARDFVETSVLLPPHTACMVCLWSPKYRDHILEQEVRAKCDEFFLNTLPKFPTISTLTSMVATIMASEAMKILVGLKRWRESGTWEPDLTPALGTRIVYNLRSHETTVSRILPNPRCVEFLCRTLRRTE